MNGWSCVRRSLKCGTVLVALLLSACSSQKTFALVTVLSKKGDIAHVTSFVVTVRNEASRDQLTYPKKATSLQVTETQPQTFSISLDSSFQGRLQVGVTVVGESDKNVPNTTLGYGEGEGTLDPEHTINMTVYIQPGAVGPDADVGDGGTIDVRATGADGGAKKDAASAGVCDPAAPAAVCGANQTCLLCKNDLVAPMCALAGTKAPGAICTKNEECTAGSQCFTFDCGAKTCLRYCKADNECASGATCYSSVPCGNTKTTFKVCSQPCDPRGDATKGCAAGLRCRIFVGEVADCDCPLDPASGTDGTPCSDSSKCQVGFICVAASGARTCRPICRLDTPTCPIANRKCEKLENPNYQTFGACLPQ